MQDRLQITEHDTTAIPGFGQAGPPAIARPRMSPWKRLVWLLTIFALQMLYFPINRLMEGGIAPSTPMDDWIPVWPIWVVPYLLSLLWWTGAFAWAAWKMEAKLYRALATGIIAVMLFSYAVYIFCPTYVDRPPLEKEGWAADLLRLVYSNDRDNNALPSGHTYTTMIISLFWWRWRPRQRWLWAGIAVIVLLSTLFTGQHYLLDVVAGILVAWAGYRFGLVWAGRRS